MEHDFGALSREVRGCTDPELMARLHQMTRADRKHVARLVVYIGEVDARGLFREQAYSSMIRYAIKELRMSEAEAFLRIHTARLARQFPLILELLATGAIHLSTVKQLSPHLTQANHVHLLERASGKSRREIELLVAELDPQPDVRAQMRKLPQPKQTALVSKAVTPLPINGASQQIASIGDGDKREAAALVPDSSTVRPAIAARATAAVTSDAPCARRVDNTREVPLMPEGGARPQHRAGASSVMDVPGTRQGDNVPGVRNASDALCARRDDSARDDGARNVTVVPERADHSDIRTLAARGGADTVAVSESVQSGAAAVAPLACSASADASANDAKHGAAPVQPSGENDAPQTFVLQSPREARATCTPLGTGRYRLQLTAVSRCMTSSSSFNICCVIRSTCSDFSNLGKNPV